MLSRKGDLGFVMFGDECSFWFYYIQPYYSWVCREGEDDLEQDWGQGFHKSDKIHCCSFISGRGKISLELFHYNLTGKRFVRILSKKKAEMKKLYPEGFILAIDNHPVHKSNRVQKYINNNFMDCLEWPSYSPDLNPIEEVWGWLKMKVNEGWPKNMFDLRDSIRRNWEKLTTEMIEKYINRLEKKYRRVIELHGSRYKK